MSQNAPAPEDDSIPWAVILSVLTLSLVSAWLVFMDNWKVGEAILAVSLAAIEILSLLLGVLWLLADQEGREDLWRGLNHTFHDDYDRILKYFRIRSRK